MSACRTCGAPITWAVVFSSGKRIPLDTDHYVDRGTRFTLDPAGNAHVVTDPNVTGMPSHFASCPDADQHRRPR